MGTFPRPYVSALEKVLDSCLAAAARCGVEAGSVVLDASLVAPGREEMSVVDRRRIRCALSDVRHLRPPPQGANVLYGLCHEAGHLTVAAAAGPAPPPVVWDEALAHVLALDLFLPAVWQDHGPMLWPDPYPDYPEREVALATPAVRGGLADPTRILERHTAQLRRVAAGAGGLGGVLQQLSAWCAGSTDAAVFAERIQRASR